MSKKEIEKIQITKIAIMLFIIAIMFLTGLAICTIIAVGSCHYWYYETTSDVLYLVVLFGMCGVPVLVGIMGITISKIKTFFNKEMRRIMAISRASRNLQY